MNDINVKGLWFTKIAEGDKKAFDAFFKHYYPKLLQFARLYVKNLQEAEDVVAEVLINMLIHRKRVFSLEHFEAYLYSSVKNRALSSLRKQGKMDFYPQEAWDFTPMAITAEDPHELLVEQELRSRIHKITQNLPPKRKMVFLLIREDGLSYRQVAHLMDISERTVEVHLKLAVKSLREGIENYLVQKKAKKALKDLVKVVAPILLFF